MGDYNINLLNYDVHNNTAEFTDMMYANSFIPLVTRPTRITQSSATLIDNIFTNDLENLATSKQGIFVADIIIFRLHISIRSIPISRKK